MTDQWAYYKKKYSIWCRLSIPYTKFLEWELSCNLDFLKKKLRYLHMHEEIPWQWDTSLNMKFISASCIPYPHALKIILHSIFLKTVFHIRRNGRGRIFHLCRHVDAQNFSDFWAFQSSHFFVKHILSLQFRNFSSFRSRVVPESIKLEGFSETQNAIKLRI